MSDDVTPQEDTEHHEQSELELLLGSPDCVVSRITQVYDNGVTNAERLLIWKWLLESQLEREKLIRILEYYCTARNTRYKPGCGWAELLLPLSPMSHGDIYSSFYALISKFVPRNCKADGKPFHLFRLLLLYHDPELCAFLDTKKCFPDLYSQRWFRSLYVGKCELQVVRELWTRYLLTGDPFMTFYLGLVILVNARDFILAMDTSTSTEIAGEITTLPDKLSIEDIDDFISLAKYYAERTPLSFTRDYHGQLFGNSPIESTFGALSQALCLPISVSELLHKTSQDGVNYLVVDCRPKIQFDSGHLPGAFHLDPNTMLTDPTLFTTKVAEVLVTQSKTFLEEDLSSNHLCFMGSGREEEDQLLNMVAAHFLHRKTQFVSTARNGYKALHELLDMDLDNGLEDHDRQECLVCQEDRSSRVSDSELSVATTNSDSVNIMARMSSVVKGASDNVKTRFGSRIGSFWAENSAEKHVTSTTKSKPYRGMENVFSIGDDDEEEIDEEGDERELINIKIWEDKADIKSHFSCEEISQDGRMIPSVLMLTSTYIYMVHLVQDKRSMGYINSRKPYATIARITAKKKHPDVITMKFIQPDSTLQTYRFLIPNSKTVTSAIMSHIPDEGSSS